MQIIHRISVASSPQVQKELAALGVAVAAGGLVSFDVDESSVMWTAMERWVASRQAVDVARTKFSNDEVSRASWLELLPDWHHGFPQPEPDAFGYREVTYDVADFCPQCGIGMKQKAPFQMKGEPKWGKKGILQLNWVFDEFFATPEVWEEVFEPHAVACRQVFNTTGTALKTVVQLVANEEVDLVVDALRPNEGACSTCGRVRYLPETRGRFPPLASEPSSAMVKTRQFFGTGAAAGARVLVSNALGRALSANKVRGASLRPLVEQGCFS